MESQQHPWWMPLSEAAKRLHLTPHGTLKILIRAGMAIRADGRWYARPADIDAIERARSLLGKRPSRTHCPATAPSSLRRANQPHGRS
jgi:hypothetical protein